MKQIIFGEELSFDHNEHAYRWGGKLVPGVTSVLQVIGKPMLVPWAAKMTSEYFVRELENGRTDIANIAKESKGAHKRFSQDAANIGHNVHDYAEKWFKKQDTPYLETDQAKRGVEAFHKWIDAHDIEVLASERRVFSKEFYYAGTCDFVAKIDGVLGVGDIKTSSGIYPEMRLQTAAYQHAMEEEKGIKFPVRWIIRFDKKTGDFEAKSFYNFDIDFEAFKSALSLHRALQTITNEENYEQT